jgi:hypothetical protein
MSVSGNRGLMDCIEGGVGVALRAACVHCVAQQCEGVGIGVLSVVVKRLVALMGGVKRG